jgi:hypothetical protein
MQQLGCDQTGADVIGGMLSILPDRPAMWTPMEEEISKVQIMLGNTILEEKNRNRKNPLKTKC